MSNMGKWDPSCLNRGRWPEGMARKDGRQSGPINGSRTSRWLRLEFAVSLTCGGASDNIRIPREAGDWSCAISKEESYDHYWNLGLTIHIAALPTGAIVGSRLWNILLWPQDAALFPTVLAWRATSSRYDGL